MSRPLLNLGDRETALDLASFLRRARALDDDGARLTLVPGEGADAPARLDVTVPVLTRSGLLDARPEVFAVRSWSVPQGHPAADAVFEHGALLDRLERGDGTEWPLPPSEIHRAWAGQAVPRSGWARAGVLEPAALKDADARGTREIAEALPEAPGQAVLAQARRAVWGRADEALGGLPGAVGFAAVKLGFLGAGSSEPVPVLTRQDHVLVSGRYGSVVVRIPGLSPAR